MTHRASRNGRRRDRIGVPPTRLGARVRRTGGTARGTRCRTHSDGAIRSTLPGLCHVTGSNSAEGGPS